MGHSSTRAAIIYQHATEERDRVIADTLDTMLVGHVPGESDPRSPNGTGTLRARRELKKAQIQAVCL